MYRISFQTFVLILFIAIHLALSQVYPQLEACRTLENTVNCHKTAALPNYISYWS